MTSILHNMNRNGHDANPFGYDFQQQQQQQQQHDTFAETASIPIGAPLLNDAESGFLGDFFGQPGDFLFPNLDLTTALPLHDHSQNANDFNWLLENGPPVLIDAQPTPRVMVSPNPMPAAIHTNDFFHTIPNGTHRIGNEATDLFSTTALVDNRMQHQSQLHVSPPHLLSRSPSQRPKSSSTIRPELTSSYSMPTSLTAIAPPQSTFGFRANPHLDQLDTTVTHTTDFHLDGSQSAPPGQRPRLADQLTDARYYRFGTDAHFSGGEFQPLHQGEQGSVVEKSLTKNLWLLGRDVKHEENHQIGGTVTTPSERGSESKKRLRDDDHEARDGSPLDVKRIKADHIESGDESCDASLAVRRPTNQQRGSNGPAKLRRINSSASDASPNGNRRRRNSSSMPQGPPPTSNGNGGSVSSATAAANAKAARENLSEEQKRSNHIMSEQKRRNLIKAGFDDLHNMVPELKQGGLSKSNVLVETANFLEVVINANMELKKRLGRL